MEQQGEKVETKHTRRAVLLSIPKVVLPIVALDRKYAVVSVFDLPSPPSFVGNRENGVSRQPMIGDTTIVVQVFACGGIDNRNPLAESK